MIRWARHTFSAVEPFLWIFTRVVNVEVQICKNTGEITVPRGLSPYVRKQILDGATKMLDSQEYSHLREEGK